MATRTGHFVLRSNDPVEMELHFDQREELTKVQDKILKHIYPLWDIFTDSLQCEISFEYFDYGFNIDIPSVRIALRIDDIVATQSLHIRHVENYDALKDTTLSLCNGLIKHILYGRREI